LYRRIHVLLIPESHLHVQIFPVPSSRKIGINEIVVILCPCRKQIGIIAVKMGGRAVILFGGLLFLLVTVFSRWTLKRGVRFPGG